MDKRSALIIVDLQYDFCPGGSLEVPEGDVIVPVVNRMAPGFPLVVASQDWHPDGHISFASQHPEKEPFDTAEINGQEWVLWPDHCVKATPGAEIHKDVDMRPVKLILRKGMDPRLDSYSVFFENDGETSTGLDAYLKGMGITDVYMCGLATDVCVYYSVMDGIRLGFRTFLVEDASRGIDTPAGSLQAAVDDMRRSGAEVVSSDYVD